MVFWVVEIRDLMLINPQLCSQNYFVCFVKSVARYTLFKIYHTSCCQYCESQTIANITPSFFRNMLKKLLQVLGKRSPQEGTGLTLFKQGEMGSDIFHERLEAVLLQSFLSLYCCYTLRLLAAGLHTAGGIFIFASESFLRPP